MRHLIRLIMVLLITTPGVSLAEMLSDEFNLNEGMKYLDGNGVETDVFKAAEYFERSNNGIAYYMLGGMYSNTDKEVAKYVLPSNEALAEKYMSKAFSALQIAEASGDASAKAYLGNMFYYGIGVEIDRVRGLSLIKQAADSGYSRAWRLLGNITMADDPDEAYGYFEKAVNLGDRESEAGLVRVNEIKYAETFNDVYKDRIRKLSEEGNSFAMITMAIYESHAQKYTVSMSLLNKASLDNLSSAKSAAFSLIALMYHRGQGVEVSRAMSLSYLNEACKYDVYECYKRDLYKGGKEDWP